MDPLAIGIAALAAGAILLIVFGLAGNTPVDPVQARLTQLGTMQAKNLEELELQGREGGQRAADPGGEEGVGEAVLGVIMKTGEGIAEQQGADHVDGKGGPGPLARSVRRSLRQADPGQRPELYVKQARPYPDPWAK